MIMLSSLIWLALSVQSASPSALTSVAGVYEMHGTVERDSCHAAALPASMFAVVVHAPGGRSLVVELGGPPAPRYYVGRVEADGEATLAAVDGVTFSEGRFTASSLAGVLTQSGIAAGQPCQTVTRWRGAKHGPPNVFGRMLTTDDGEAGTGALSGAYLIRKTVTSDTCRPTPAAPEVMTNPGVIARAAGTPIFTLSDHGTRNLTGRLSGNTWSIDIDRGLVMEKIKATDVFSAVTLTGTALTLTVTTDLAANPFREGGAACRIVTDWAAVRMGGTR